MTEEAQQSEAPTGQPQAPGNWSMPDFVQALVAQNQALIAGLTQQQQNQTPRKIGVARYLRERSVHRGKPFLTRACYQNGYPLEESQLSADAIEMLNVLKPGQYCQKFDVRPARHGNSMSGIDITYSNKSLDERMQLKSLYPTFEHMLAAMLKEQQAQSVIVA